jgi:hypothetical protein
MQKGVYVGVEGRLFLSFLGYRPYQFASRAISSYRDCGHVLQLPLRSRPKGRTLEPKKMKVKKANR